jgi:tetratricopeptide (TPR) repeat protein
MEVKLMASNLSLSLRFSLGATFILLFCFSAALAQTDSTASSTSSAENVSAKQTPLATAGKDGDRLSALRAQIASTKTGNERLRLERTLVDYLVALNKKGEAINELRAMSHEDRIDPVGFYNIGNALARLGDTDSAIESYRKAIKQRNGNYSHAQNNLGVLLLKQGRWDEAREAFLGALATENFRYAEASYNLGRLYSAQGEANLAMREWSRALMTQPDHVDAAIALARALAEDGKRERGVALLDAFITRHGASAEITDARREILFGSDEIEAASANAVPATGNARPARVENDKPSTAKNDGKTSASLRPLEVDQETYDLLQRAREARESEHNEEAATLYNRVLSRSNGFLPPANLELSFVLGSLRRYDEAITVLTTLVNRGGARYPIAYYHLGRQYEQLGKLSLAADAYEKAAEAFGDTNPQFFVDVSRVREKEGNAQAALAAMENYVRISQSKGGAPAWSTERLAQLRQKAKQN